MSTLSEARSLELAQLDIKHAAGKLAEPERTRWRLLKTGNRLAPDSTLGVRAAASPAFKALAAKTLGASENTALVDEDVQLAHVDNGAEVKALITGVSDTSAGAFVTNQPGGYVPQPRRRLRILDLVRLGDTTVDAVEYARQTTFTNAAAEVAEATATNDGHEA